jgi:hypothetical protein
MTDPQGFRLFRNRWADAVGPGEVALRASDDCFQESKVTKRWCRVHFHSERQDTSAPGWQHLLALIDEAVSDGRERFMPLAEMTLEERRQIVTPPSAIAKLTAVKHLVLYGSNLVRIPPEIGAMSGLEEFTPYTSYRLHWFPYELTRCSQLQRSTVSTRALYGKPQVSSALRPTPTWEGSRRRGRSRRS